MLILFSLRWDFSPNSRMLRGPSQLLIAGAVRAPKFLVLARSPLVAWSFDLRRPRAKNIENLNEEMVTFQQGSCAPNFCWFRWSHLVAPGCSWSLLVAPGRSWSPLVVLLPGRSWLLLVTPLLVAPDRSCPGHSWSLLVIPGHSLVIPSRSWSFLFIPGGGLKSREGPLRLSGVDALV